MDEHGEDAGGGTVPPRPGYPVAHPGYGTPYPPYGGPSRSAGADSIRAQSIVALVVSVFSVASCCLPTGIAAAITSGIALSCVDTDLSKARTLVRWSWGLLAASVVLVGAGLADLVAIGVFSGG